jgi:alpha-glucosidase
MNFKWAAMLAAVCFPIVAGASGPECAQSPGHVIKVCVSVHDGRATFEVSRLNQPVLGQSNLGLEFRGEHEARYSAIASVNRSSSDTSWEQPWGEQRTIRDRHTEMTITLMGNTPFTQAVEVTFRLFDEGLGFRYRYDSIPAAREVAVSADRTSFHTLGDYVAWWYQALGQERDEYLYTHTDARRITRQWTVSLLS